MRLPRSTETRCATCGALLAPGDRFCGHCGHEQTTFRTVDRLAAEMSPVAWLGAVCLVVGCAFGYLVSSIGNADGRAPAGNGGRPLSAIVADSGYGTDQPGATLIDRRDRGAGAAASGPLNPSPTPRVIRAPGSIAAAPSPTPAPLPPGIPAGAIPATVERAVDGGTLVVRTGDRLAQVLLAGIDPPKAPAGSDLGDCYGREAAVQLRRTLPPGRAVYVEPVDQDGVTGSRIRGFVWSVPDDGGQPQLANEAILRGGYAALDRGGGGLPHDDRLAPAAATAQAGDAGLWGACGNAHVAITPTPQRGDANQPAALGTTLTGSGLAITPTLNGIYDNLDGQRPQGGYLFLVLDVTIENVDQSGRSHAYAGALFSATGVTSGAAFDNTHQPLGSSVRPLSWGEISPGEYVSGQVVLEVQETASAVRVKYDTALLGGTNVFWLVQR